LSMVRVWFGLYYKQLNFANTAFIFKKKIGKSTFGT
jgi:hypothetical protein